MDKKIVIIGAGPVGLMMAYLLNKRGYTDVTVIEKRRGYHREQVLLLDAKSLKMLPKSVYQSIWKGEKGCFVLSPPKDRAARCYKQPLKLASVPIKTLEKNFYSYLRKNTNIHFVRKKCKIHKSKILVEGKLIKYDILIGADGIGSEVAEKVIGTSRKKIKGNYHYGMVATIRSGDEEVSGSPSSQQLQIVKNTKPQNSWRFFRRRKGGYYVAIIISKKEADEMVETETIPKYIKTRIHGVCQLVHRRCQVRYSQVNVFPIEPSYAVTGYKNNAFLIGDALVNTHFFSGTGINIGWKTAQTLLNYITSDGYSSTEYMKLQKENIDFIIKKVLALKFP